LKIGLYCDVNGPVRGPHKVAKNLIAGLGKLGIDVSLNKTEDLTGCLHSGPYLYSLPRTTLLGPNILVTPPDDPRVWGLYTDIVVPSKWVQDKYASFSLTKANRLHIWSVGIDTDSFNDANRDPTIDCLLYAKNKSPAMAEYLLKKKGMSYMTLTYGSYQESDLIQALKKCRFCILCTGTESQGIAYMEILSSGLPCFVLDETMWMGRFPATSVPYFSEECGVIARDPKQYEEFFNLFTNSISSYHPREYIIGDHTLEKGAYRYMELLKFSHGVS